MDRGEPRTQVLQVLERFTRKEVEPRAPEFDREPLHPGLGELLSQARSLGLLSLRAPPEMGGCGLDLPGFASAIREVARGCAGVSALLMVHNSCAPLLPSPGDKGGLLAPVFGGSLEATAGGELRGTAGFVPAAMRADTLLVFPRQAGCFRVPAGAPGVQRRPHGGQGGLRACAAAEVTFDGARGEPVEARREDLFASLHIGAAAIALGIGDGARAAAHRYAAERYQGGVPIIEHQQVRLLLSRMWLDARAASSLLREACESPIGGLSLAAKIAASEAALRAATDAVQILGGYGYMRDYGVEKRMRDAAILLSWPEVNQEAMLRLPGGP